MTGTSTGLLKGPFNLLDILPFSPFKNTFNRTNTVEAPEIDMPEPDVEKAAMYAEIVNSPKRLKELLENANNANEALDCLRDVQDGFERRTVENPFKHNYHPLISTLERSIG